jgi:hypothetical protein
VARGAGCGNALDVLHHQEEMTTRGDHVVEANHGRIIEPGEGLGLPTESLHGLGSLARRRQESLHGSEAIERVVASEHDHAETAAPELSDERVSGRQHHVSSSHARLPPERLARAYFTPGAVLSADLQRSRSGAVQPADVRNHLTDNPKEILMSTYQSSAAVTNAQDRASEKRFGIRRLGRAATVLLVSAGLLVASAGTADASVVSGYGGSAMTISYCGNSHTLHGFNYKNFVFAEYPGQVVAAHTMVLDAAGWHDHGWRSRYGSAVFGTTVEYTTGWNARVFTQYAWLNSRGWHFSVWNESTYRSIFGPVMATCAI